MIIKRYLVDNMNEAMTRIRYELGIDAIIVSQKKIRQKGFKGFFKGKKIEVTAAVDDKNKKNSAADDKKDTVQKEINELKEMLQDLMTQREMNNEKVQQTENVEPKREGKSKLKQKLIEKDIPEDIVEDIYSRIKSKYPDKRLTAKVYEKEVRNIFDEIIKTDKKLEGRIQVLIGPTGVGKTTTIAKLASLFTLYKNKKVGLITFDTYRIGAVEQLKTYAEILGVPFKVVLSTKEIPEVLNSMKNCDIIFVDTAGRNSKNIMQVSETRKFVEELKADRIHLVLSMTTKQKDIKTIIENYRMINYDSLILTKVDETDTCGSMFTSLYYAGVPVTFITSGQNVPEDIEEANAEKLVKLILEAE